MRPHFMPVFVACCCVEIVQCLAFGVSASMAMPAKTWNRNLQGLFSKALMQCLFYSVFVKEGVIMFNVHLESH